jgi:hypothetical protein
MVGRIDVPEYTYDDKPPSSAIGLRRGEYSRRVVGKARQMDAKLGKAVDLNNQAKRENLGLINASNARINAYNAPGGNRRWIPNGGVNEDGSPGQMDVRYSPGSFISDLQGDINRQTPAIQAKADKAAEFAEQAGNLQMIIKHLGKREQGDYQSKAQQAKANGLINAQSGVFGGGIHEALGRK